jgi:cytochrome bd-type quinol oxidase subunit 1
VKLKKNIKSITRINNNPNIIIIIGMKDSFVQECLGILKRDDVKNEVKSLLRPVMGFILYELNPYIYAIVIMVFLIFVMILTILFILISLLRNKQNAHKLF